MHMKNIFRSLSIAALLGWFVPFISSCDDDEEVFNEWNATYVSLQRQDYLSGDIKNFKLSHDATGVGGDEIMMTFNVKTQQPAPADITVKLGVECEKGLTDLITLSNTTIILPKGKMISEDITATVDRESFSEIKEKFQHGFQISISNIATSDKNTVISNNLCTLHGSISKAAFCNLRAASPENSTLLDTKDKWKFTFQDGVEHAGDNTVAGTGSNDVATNGVPFWVTVDLEEFLTLCGIKTGHWGPVFAPSEVEIFISTDGTDWTSLGVIATTGSPQYITFITPVKTRYLKYQMIEVPDRVDLTSFDVFIPDIPEVLPENWKEIARTGWNIACDAAPYDGNYSLEGMLDGNVNTGYFTYIGSAAPIIVDMTVAHTVKGVSITADGHYYQASYSLKELRILTSTDGEKWDDLGLFSIKRASNGTSPRYIIFDKSISTRYIQIVPVSVYENFFGISEFCAYE